MAIVNYKNSPSEETPLTGGVGGNLNLMQENGTTHGTDTKLGYSQAFLNDHLVNISNEVDDDYKVNLLETKNLFNYKDITQSANYTNQGDGSFVRTSDGRSITINCNSSSQPYGDFKLKKGTYSLSFDILLTGAMTMGNLNIQTYQNGTLVNIAKSLNIPIPANTLTHIVAEEVVLENDAEAVGFASFLSPSGTNVGITISNIQFEKGSSATTYSSFITNQIVVDNEKYTDTLNVSPYIDSRSRVNVLHSKNLFDYNNYTINNTSNGTFTIVNDTLNFNNNTGNAYVITFKKIKVKPNTKYTLNGIPNDPNNNNLIYIKFEYDSSGTQVKQNYPQALNTNTFTTTSTTQYIELRLTTQNLNTQGNYSFKAMLNEGDTALDYEPYIVPNIVVDNEEIYSKPVLLWENGSPSNDFASGNITLNDDISKYNYYEILFLPSKTETTRNMSTGRIPTDMYATLNTAFEVNRRRRITSLSSTTMGIGEGSVFATYNGSATTNNSVCIPVKILGYK